MCVVVVDSIIDFLLDFDTPLPKLLECRAVVLRGRAAAGIGHDPFVLVPGKKVFNPHESGEIPVIFMVEIEVDLAPRTAEIGERLAGLHKGDNVEIVAILLSIVEPVVNEGLGDEVQFLFQSPEIVNRIRLGTAC